MIFQKYKKWIIIALVLIVSFVLYSIFFTGDDGGLNEDDLLSSNIQQSPNQIVGDEIISALNQIESLRLDRSIFDDIVYLSLVDRSREIPPEPVGKANPFDSIGSSAPENSTTPKIKDEETTATNESSNRGPTTIIRTTNVSAPVI